MPDIFFPSRNISVEELFASNDQAAIDGFIRDNMRGNLCSSLMTSSPYCLARTRPEDKMIVTSLGIIPRQDRDQLMCLVDNFGGSTTTLAALYDKHLSGFDMQHSTGLVGAGSYCCWGATHWTSACTSRLPNGTGST